MLGRATLKEIQELTYQIKKADGSGDWKTSIFTKTIYDPSKISDSKMIEYGKEAMDEAIKLGIRLK